VWTLGIEMTRRISLIHHMAPAKDPAGIYYLSAAGSARCRYALLSSYIQRSAHFLVAHTPELLNTIAVA